MVVGGGDVGGVGGCIGSGWGGAIAVVEALGGTVWSDGDVGGGGVVGIGAMWASGGAA